MNEMEMQLTSELAIGSVIPLHRLEDLKSFRGLTGESNLTTLENKILKKSETTY